MVADDLDAEAQALAHAARHPNVHAALAFRVNWRAHTRAARIVVARRNGLDGDLFPVLTPAANALAEAHPLTATVLLRAMIDVCLANVKTARYRHAGRHLDECAQLAGRIPDVGDLDDHPSHLAQLQARHGRNVSLWRHVKQSAASDAP